ncbi:hypothetical protein AM587_10005424 [Phytophthora nicotianae]|uniref:Uncharacterized protein n=1 Tax=Phytophthora nicotianae TaxID=4792 RepID=A0A0W8BVP4_PHYNI|nr:hypothetical protein AM587_10005424 [Phytophthora nicotianae]
MASIREMLETECTTQVQYIPPGVTALSQPMDVSVMRTFKKKIDESKGHGQGKKHCKRFSKGKTASNRSYVSDVFAAYLHALPEAAVVDAASDIEDESFDE